MLTIEPTHGLRERQTLPPQPPAHDRRPEQPPPKASGLANPGPAWTTACLRHARQHLRDGRVPDKGRRWAQREHNPHLPLSRQNGARPSATQHRHGADKAPRPAPPGDARTGEETTRGRRPGQTAWAGGSSTWTRRAARTADPSPCCVCGSPPPTQGGWWRPLVTQTLCLFLSHTPVSGEQCFPTHASHAGCEAT